MFSLLSSIRLEAIADRLQHINTLKFMDDKYELVYYIEAMIFVCQKQKSNLNQTLKFCMFTSTRTIDSTDQDVAAVFSSGLLTFITPWLFAWG